MCTYTFNVLTRLFRGWQNLLQHNAYYPSYTYNTPPRHTTTRYKRPKTMHHVQPDINLRRYDRIPQNTQIPRLIRQQPNAIAFPKQIPMTFVIIITDANEWIMIIQTSFRGNPSNMYTRIYVFGTRYQSLQNNNYTTYAYRILFQYSLKIPAGVNIIIAFQMETIETRISREGLWRTIRLVGQWLVERRWEGVFSSRDAGVW